MTERSRTGGVDQVGEASGRIGITPFQSLDFSILKRTRPILENLLTPVIEAGTVAARVGTSRVTLRDVSPAIAGSLGRCARTYWEGSRRGGWRAHRLGLQHRDGPHATSSARTPNPILLPSRFLRS